ncbi:MAG: LPS-assembly protein LptD [Thiobacillaceae bacterium]
MLAALRALFTGCILLQGTGPVFGAEPGIVLKLDTQLRGSAVAGAEGPLFVTADRIESHEPHVVNAYGQVEARRAGQNFFADFLRYDTELHLITARDHVRMERSDGVMSGESLKLQLDTDAGEMTKLEFAMAAGPGRGHADLAEFKDKEHYSMKRALYTSCPVDDEVWKLTADDLDIDQVKRVATGHDALLTFEDVPLIYSPWMDFSLDTGRKSGFIAPTFGTTSASGLEFTVPYYFNLAPNYDATVSPRYLSKRGLQFGLEGRYLMPSFQGIAQAEFLNDSATNEARWDVNLHHQEQIAPTLVGKIDFQRVSDNNYFRDLSTLVVQTSQTLLPEQGTLNYDNGVWQSQFMLQQFQLLQDPNNPIVAPYNRLPDITLKTDQVFGAVEAKLDSEYVYFQNPSQTQGSRLSLYPQVNLPWENRFASFNANFGVNATYYSLDNSVPKPDISRVLPLSSLDGKIVLERDIDFAGNQYEQTLEPRLFYVYVPYHNQSDIPVFDTARADLNLDELFAENQYIGGDRISNANEVTLALTSRLIDPKTGQERLDVTFGQRYYFQSEQVTLPGETPQEALATNLVAGFDGQVTPAIRVDGTWQFDTVNDKTLLSDLDVSYKPATGQLLNAAYRFIEGSTEQFDFSSQWPLTKRLHGLARVDYSIPDRSLVQGLMGLEYNGGCWAVRSVIQRLTTAENSRNNAFFVQLELNGLGQIGSNPLELLKQNIPGYANPIDFTTHP